MTGTRDTGGRETGSGDERRGEDRPGSGSPSPLTAVRPWTRPGRGTGTGGSDADGRPGLVRGPLTRLARRLARPVRAAAFWAAVALPFLAAALLVEGLSTPAETATFLGLLLGSVLAMVVGHPHRQ